MNGGTILDKIEIDLVSETNEHHIMYMDVYDSPLSMKWLTALNTLLTEEYHLEKNGPLKQP